METTNANRTIQLLALSLLLAFTSDLRAATPAGKTQQLTSPDQVPDGLANSDWASIREAYEAGRHSFAPVAGGWQARNPGQQWLMRFDGRGFVAKPAAGGWQWGLELKSYGFTGQEHAISGVPAVKAVGQRLTYAWDAAVEEWFVNDARGLEHGFTVRERPTAGAEAGDPLQFNLAVRGSLAAQVGADGLGVEFRDPAGAVVLRYGGLKVWDADGKVLSARFAPTVASATGALRLLVEERGARYPITVDPIAQQAYLKASNTQSGDLFGFSVAVSGDTVVVGAVFEDGSGNGVNPADNNLAINAGAAYVFVRSGASWSQQAYLKASNTGAGDRFGTSVAVSGDTVVVGASFEDGSGNGVNPADNNLTAEAGAAYVFVRSGTSWSQQAYLKASNTGPGDTFGVSVAVSGDTLVVGSTGEDGNGTGVNPADNNLAGNAGAAYVFVRSGTSWSQQAHLKASNTGDSDAFGISVAVSGDTVVVGANSEDGSGNGVNPADNNLASFAGAAYVFVRSGTSWSQQAYLKASNTGAGDEFGRSVAVSGDTVVIGAIREEGNGTGVNPGDNNLLNSGAAYVFVRGGTSWSQQAYLKASNTGRLDEFGISVAVSGDTVVVGARVEDGSGNGVNPADNNLAADAGAAYVFVRSGTTWSHHAYLKASNTGAGDEFAFSVSVSGDTVVVGARLEDGSGNGVNPVSDEGAGEAGAAYVFSLMFNSPPTASFTSAAAPVFHCTSLDGATTNVTINVADADNNPLTVKWSVNSVVVATHTLAAGATSDTLVNQLFGFAPSTLSVSVSDGIAAPVIISTTVTVSNHEEPAPNVAFLPTLTGECSVTITNAPTAWDDCAFGDPAGLIIGTTTDPLSYTAQGTNIVTWKYTDPHDATKFTMQEQVVVVRDVTPPTISCPAAVSVAYGSVPAAATNMAEFLAQGGAVADNCNPNGTVSSYDSEEGYCPIVITRTYVVTDAAGNGSSCTQTIMVNNLFAGDGIIWHQPLARNGASEDTDPSDGNTLKYRFKLGSTIPIMVHAQGCSGDVTANANVIGTVVVFGDTDCNGVADAGELPIDYNGVGEAGGVMDKIDGHLKYNLDTKKLPQTVNCYILQVTVTDSSTSESRVETVPLQAK